MCETKCSSASWICWPVGAVAGYVALRALVWLISDVLSLNGLLYSIGIGSGESLHFPLVARVMTWLILLELCAAAGVVANYRERRWRQSWAWNWLLGHVKFVGWLFRGVRAAVLQAIAVTTALPALVQRKTDVTVLLAGPAVDDDYITIVTDQTA